MAMIESGKKPRFKEEEKTKTELRQENIDLAAKLRKLKKGGN